MGSPIRKLVQLVLDRNSANKTSADAKRSLSSVDKALARVKRSALNLGAAFASAFAIRRVAQFARDSVRAARDQEAIWNRLGGTINNAGGNFEEMTPRIRNMARAMQDATTIGDDQFAATLQSLVNISQDVEGSLENVALVADLSAAANIDLNASALLVGRAMVGQTALLSRYGIVVEEGADAVQSMRDQFRGMAANEALALDGQVKQLNNEWGDFKEAIGDAIIEAGDGASVMTTLTAVVKDATIWVENNHEAFTTLGNVLAGTVRGLGMVIDEYLRLSRFLSSGFTFAFSGIVRLMAAGTDGMVAFFDASQKINEFLGRDEAADRAKLTTDALRERAAALRETADIALQAAADLRDEATRVRSEAASGGARDRPGRITTRDRVESGGDTLSDEAKKELDALEKEAERITQAVRTPLEVYRDTIAQLRTHRDADRISQETYTRAVAEARETYKSARDALKEEAGELSRVDEAMLAHQQSLDASKTLYNALGEEVNLLELEEQSLLATLRVLSEEGLTSTDDRFATLVRRLSEVRGGLQSTQTELETTAVVAQEVGGIVGAAMGSGIGPLAEGKARQNAILAAEELAHGFAALLNPFTSAKAAGHFTAAAKYGAVATAWKALASSTGGSGGFAGGGRSGGGGGPATAAAARDAGGPGSERVAAPETEVHIHFVGEGFDAVNPRVQQVVAGAQQLANERFGKNTAIRIHRRP